MISHVGAIAYAGLISLPLAMQLVLAAGAPWGKFTVGGRFPGRLPPLWRGLAVLQGGLLVFMAATVLDRGGVADLGLENGPFWLSVALTGLTLLANAASPSRPERLLWTPVTGAMMAAAVAVALS
jgi:hypothetical protein